jgi:hypothetical protein
MVASRRYPKVNPSADDSTPSVSKKSTISLVPGRKLIGIKVDCLGMGGFLQRL